MRFSHSGADKYFLCVEAEFHVNLENDGWLWVPRSRGPSYTPYKGTYKCLFEFLEDRASRYIPVICRFFVSRKHLAISSGAFFSSRRLHSPLREFFLSFFSFFFLPRNESRKFHREIRGRMIDRCSSAKRCSFVVHKNPRNFYFRHVGEHECLPLCRWKPLSLVERVVSN